MATDLQREALAKAIAVVTASKEAEEGKPESYLLVAQVLTSLTPQTIDNDSMQLIIGLVSLNNLLADMVAVTTNRTPLDVLSTLALITLDPSS